MARKHRLASLKTDSKAELTEIVRFALDFWRVALGNQ